MESTLTLVKEKSFMFVAKRSGIGGLISYKLEKGNNMHLTPSLRESTLKVVKEKSFMFVSKRSGIGGLISYQLEKGKSLHLAP